MTFSNRLSGAICLMSGICAGIRTSPTTRISISACLIPVVTMPRVLSMASISETPRHFFMVQTRPSVGGHCKGPFIVRSSADPRSFGEGPNNQGARRARKVSTYPGTTNSPGDGSRVSGTTTLNASSTHNSATQASRRFSHIGQASSARFEDSIAVRSMQLDHWPTSSYSNCNFRSERTGRIRSR